eukprot:TRINITY_DN1170_c0_g1_i1.p1 TRINITY_DN1170_c0_g1~~TRINITY_DN1170_c0_g1_i1.p1  ORF type:complete len:422 (-),score=63.91 TRINITY_DN1170_c0_g1_i1:559-1824(-)
MQDIIKRVSADISAFPPISNRQTLLQDSGSKFKAPRELHTLHPSGVICHAFSPDGTMIAASIKKQNVVEIYKVGDFDYPDRWELLYQLTEHRERISSVDWSIKNQLLTCSYDRNIFVWDFDAKGGLWNLEEVEMDHKRAVLCGQWDRFGDKFVVATGTNQVFVGFFEKRSSTWKTAPVIDSRKHSGFKSTVLCVAFHPSSRVVAAGSSDHTVKIMTCYIDEIDRNYAVSDSVVCFSDVKSFGEVLFNFDFDSSVHSLMFSPKGNALALTSNNNFIGCVKTTSDQKFEVGGMMVKGYPFLSVCFVDEERILAGGYANVPVTYKTSGKAWKFVRALDTPIGERFESLPERVHRGHDALPTREVIHHTNPIVCSKKYTDGVMTTQDLHGNLFFWRIPDDTKNHECEASPKSDASPKSNETASTL